MVDRNVSWIKFLGMDCARYLAAEIHRFKHSLDPDISFWPHSGYPKDMVLHRYLRLILIVMALLPGRAIGAEAVRLVDVPGAVMSAGTAEQDCCPTDCACACACSCTRTVRVCSRDQNPSDYAFDATSVIFSAVPECPEDVYLDLNTQPPRF